MITRLIVSINRNSPDREVEEVADLAIDCYKNYPDVVVGIEVSGDPTVGCFQSYMPALEKARAAGLKVSSKFWIRFTFFLARVICPAMDW